MAELHARAARLTLRPAWRRLGQWRRAHPRRAVCAALALACVLGLLALRAWPHAPLRERFSESIALYDRHGELLRLTLASDQQYRLWTPLAQISPLLIDSVLLYEDRSFWWHPGVNPFALLRSAAHRLGGGRRQGGSTLSMQLARRVYGIDSRSAHGKLAQIAAALWLEARYSKRAILEAYLNSAPYGGNIEGVGSASLIYFRQPASALRMPEALALAVIPQNPARRLAAGGTARDGNAELERARARLWSLWLAHRGEAAQAHAAEALMRPPARSRNALPFAAPHLTDMLLAQHPHQALREADGAIHTTLDLRMQRTLERVTAAYLKTRADHGLRNASAILLDASTMEVRALLGSANYHEASIAGQVNGSLGKRSPGSTLKPFIYALALDQGLMHPRTVLKDAPTSFGPFTPENYDGQFVGPLAAQDALTRSRNVPAVALAARLSQPNLYQFLQLNQISRLRSQAHYGLALVLGGGEVTPEELARLYAVLANGGQARPLAYTRAAAQRQRQAAGSRVLSDAAAFITLDMLRNTPRPDTGRRAQPQIAWKTGTSWGFRDAWTAGVFGRHVLVVWIGNFDGAGNPAFIGLDAAAPLFLRIVDALRAEGLDPGEVHRAQAADLQRVEVCSATGGVPDALCPNRVTTWFIAGKSPLQGNALHRRAWIDPHTGRTVCGPAPAPDAKPVVVENWSSDLHSLFRQAGLPRRMLEPAHCADEAEQGGDPAPSIRSPLRAVSYQQSARKPQALLLRADAAGGVKTLYWYADAALLGRSAPGESLPWTPPRPGRYTLRVVDDHGRADLRTLEVQAQP